MRPSQLPALPTVASESDEAANPRAVLCWSQPLPPPNHTTPTRNDCTPEAPGATPAPASTAEKETTNSRVAASAWRWWGSQDPFEHHTPRDATSHKFPPHTHYHHTAAATAPTVDPAPALARRAEGQQSPGCQDRHGTDLDRSREDPLAARARRRTRAGRTVRVYSLY
eukprot:COSAG02_NODE_9531_length_2188_cov_2.042125_1_plen_168_part_00